MSQQFEPVNSQGQIRAGELSRMARRLESRKALVSRGMGTMQSQSGEVAQLAIQETFLAQITAGPSPGDGSYTWVEVLEPTPGTFAPRVPGRSGGSGNMPAFEINGVIIPVLPVVVRMWQGLGYYYEFEHGAGTGGSSAVTPTDQDSRYCTILLHAVAPGDATILVQSSALFPKDPNTGVLLPFTILIDQETLGVASGLGGAPDVWTLAGPARFSHYNYTPVCQPQPAIKTTLQGGTDANSTLINVNDPANFPPFGRFYIKIDSELMLLWDGAGTQNWTVRRGALGTQKAAHDSGAIVYQALPDSVRNAATLIFDEIDFVQPGTFDPNQEQSLVAVHKEVYQHVRMTSQTRTGKGYYPGVIEVWDSVNLMWIDSYPVWLRSPNS